MSSFASFSRIRFLFAPVLLAAFSAFVCHSDTSNAAGQPNIVIFYADDLGWGETGVQGCKDIATPNIDSIAKHGIRCTQGYVAATYCSPSRAGLMTGRYPTRFGHEFNSVASKTTGLSLNETTIADRLKSLGYATACVGKWHLGGSMDHRPTKRGFDEFYGTLGNTPYYHPTQFVDSRESLDVKPIDDKEFYTTDQYAARAVDLIEKAKGKPLFLYFPFNAQHGPLQAPQKYFDRVSKIEDEKRRTFAAVMTAMDDAIGKVIEKFNSLGQLDNTLIFFIGDNGGPTAGTTSQNGGLRGFKMTTFEGGPRVPFLVQWTSKLPQGKTYDHPVINLDVLPTAVMAAGGKVDSQWKVDGVDLTPYLSGTKTEKPHDKLFWRYGDQWAVRDGDYKLVVSKGGSGKPELYNLASDRNETKDLAGDQPEKVEQLTKLYKAWDAEQSAPSAPKEKPAKANKKPGRGKAAPNA